MPHTFVDEDLEAQFAVDGYVVIPFLTPRDVAELRDLWDTTFGTGPEPFETTALHPDRRVTLPIHQELRSRFRDRIDACMVDHEMLHGYYLCKRPVPDDSTAGEVPPHQDWSYVDEGQVRGVLMWCPLVDAIGRNGPLAVVPGSHRWSHAPRGTGEVRWALEPRLEEIRANMVVVEAKAGDAVVYDAALVHASAPNRGVEARPVVGLGVAPRGAPLYRYHADAPGEVVRYEVEPEFFTEEPLAGRPQGRVRGQVEVHPPSWAPW